MKKRGDGRKKGKKMKGEMRINRRKEGRKQRTVEEKMDR